MKKTLFSLAILLALPAMLMAQMDTEEFGFYQTIFGSEKKVIMASFIELEGEAKDAFWELYDEYEEQRMELGKKRLQMLEDYAGKYGSMDDAQSDATITSFMKQQKEVNKLVDSYYKKIRKATDASSAAQFYHLELFFLAAIRVHILESMPVIGELGN